MKTKSLSESGEKILAHLKRCRCMSDAFHSPTSIGIEFGIVYDRASSWVSPKVTKLVKVGLVERNKTGHYRYKL
jgi:hypothetical protein